MAGIEQGFSVLSQVEVSTGDKKQSFTPAETKNSLCHHAFVGKIWCDLNLPARARLARGALILLLQLMSYRQDDMRVRLTVDWFMIASWCSAVPDGYRFQRISPV